MIWQICSWALLAVPPILHRPCLPSTGPSPTSSQVLQHRFRLTTVSVCCTGCAPCDPSHPLPVVFLAPGDKYQSVTTMRFTTSSMCCAPCDPSHPLPVVFLAPGDNYQSVTIMRFTNSCVCCARLRPSCPSRSIFPATGVPHLWFWQLPVRTHDVLHHLLRVLRRVPPFP